MGPSEAVSATAEPVMPAKNMDVSTFTWPRPPLILPTKTSAILTRRLVIPERFMSSPDSTKKGMARKGKLSNPVNIRWEMSPIGIPFWSEEQKAGGAQAE